MKSFLKDLVNKFAYAFDGLFHGLVNDKSIKIQFGCGIMAFAAGIVLKLETWEWIVFIGFITAVIALEFLNSAIETVVDMIHPEYGEKAKKIKDYCATAVLVVCIGALLSAIFILKGKLL